VLQYEIQVEQIIGKIEQIIVHINQFFWIMGLKMAKHLVFLTHFLSKILKHNSECRCGNVKGVVTCDNY
jgi:hypothetical protein